MCVNPISIPNPQYARSVYRSERGELVKLSSNLYSHRKYIDVPCGKCVDCRNTYYNSILQRCLVEARSSYMYFVTLTYDNKHIPCVDVAGHTIYYANYQHIVDMFKRLRAANLFDRDFRYICVNEYGDKRHRPHFHLLIFLARKDTDTKVTPYILQQLLFDNLQKYYAVNVGTRKHPIYEKLFTYVIRRTSSGLKSNYFVKYVDCQLDDSLTFVNESETLVKTVRYLIGYINKGSKFDSYLDTLFEPYRLNDPILYAKLRHLLCCKVRYSKGLGFGFIDGKKHILKPISEGCTINRAIYSDIIKTMPKTYEEFSILYPDLSEKLIDYLWHNKYNLFDTLQEYLQSIDTLEYFLHCLALLYFPETINRIFKECYFDTHCDTPTVSYYMNFLKLYIYQYAKVDTYSVDTQSSVYNLIRGYLSQGLTNKVPFLPFVIPGTTPQYVPLCSFYKRYCTTSEDVLNMYKSIGVSSYDEWQELFEHHLQTTLRRASISDYNKFRDELSENLIFNLQNSCISLSQQNIFSVLFDIQI